MQIQGRLSAEKIRAAADQAGVDWQRLTSDLEAHAKEIDAALARSDRQAGMLGISGTPAMFVGPYLVAGALTPDQLRQAVAIARQYPDGDAPQANCSSVAVEHGTTVLNRYTEPLYDQIHNFIFFP